MGYYSYVDDNNPLDNMNREEKVEIFNETFPDLLKQARVVEEEVKEILLKSDDPYFYRFIRFNNYADFDLKFEDKTGRVVTVEVKEDKAAGSTGKVAVEFRSWGKPSGIITSEADFWVYKIHESDGTISYVMFDREDLKILATRFNVGIAIKAGEEKQSSLFLVMLSQFLARGVIIARIHPSGKIDNLPF